jgi:hypothetical protein
MNVHQLIVFMDFMMNVNDDIILNYGKHLQIVLIVFLLLQLLMKKFFVAMEV